MRVSVFLFSAALVAALLSAAAGQTVELRIGTYDSRAVAIAYANSAVGRSDSAKLQEQMKAAQASGDEKQIGVIKQKGSAMQQLRHLQGFSTGSVADIMEAIKASLPALAQQANVQMIVSKWDVNYAAPAVQLVDVTDQVVALFHPTPQGMKWIEQLREHPPISMESALMPE